MKFLTTVFLCVVAVAAVTVATLLSVRGGDVRTPTTRLTADTSAYAVSYSESTEDNSLSQTDSAPSPSDRGSTGLASSGNEETFTQSASSRGYILSNRWTGQQGSSIRAVLSLQCWATSFSLPVRIVDPFLGMDGGVFISMSALIDIKHFNSVSQQTSEPSIATWLEFFDRAPRSVIIVDVIDPNGKSCNSKHGLYTNELDINDSDFANKSKCLDQKYLKNPMPVLSKFDYCIERVVKGLSVACCSKSPNDYREIIDAIYRGRDVTKFTVVFTVWSAICDCQNPDSLYRINCSDPLKTKFKNKLTPSKQLLDDAKYYTDHFLHSRNKLAVMIRAEQTVMKYSGNKADKAKHLRECLQKTVNVTQNFNETMSRNGETGILLTVDIGKFGTQAIEVVQKHLQGGIEEMTDLVKPAFVKIYRDEWTFEDYEKSFTIASKGNENPVYIAALQRTLASQADCLILMGGGDFQLLALHDYLDKHPNPCVHFVCLNKYNEDVYRLAVAMHHNNS